MTRSYHRAILAWTVLSIALLITAGARAQSGGSGGPAPVKRYCDPVAVTTAPTDSRCDSRGCDPPYCQTWLTAFNIKPAECKTPAEDTYCKMSNVPVPIVVFTYKCDMTVDPDCPGGIDFRCDWRLQTDLATTQYAIDCEETPAN